MILLAYACLLIATVAFVRNSAVDVSGPAATPVRVLSAIAGLGFSSVGALLLGRGVGIGIVLAVMLVVGGLTYVWGVARRRAVGALAVRRTGWALIAGALAFPSTLTLLLPIACLLLPTLHRLGVDNEVPAAGS